MNKLDKEDYNCLKACTKYTRSKIKSFDEDGLSIYRDECPQFVEERLISKGFIDLQGESRHTITDSGRKELNRLEVIKWKFWTTLFTGLTMLFTLIILGRTFGWW